jgi:hypothetical protein
MKTIKKVYVVALLLMACGGLAMLQSCRLGCAHGSGHQLSETRKMGEFSKIEISGDFKIILKQDSSLNLNITADDNLLKYIKTRVDGNKLIIRTKKSFCNSGAMVVIIGVHKLEELKAAGALEISSDGLLTTKDISFNFAGASKITLNLNADNVTTSGAGVTEMNLKGQATSHHVDISGVAKLYAFDFVVSDYDIQTSGAGHCDVNVLKTLRISSSGASEVKYKGNPSSVSNDKSGAGSVEKVN